MLVLTRLVNEEIMIGDDIRITVVAMSGNQVRIGITAPRDVAVHRGEVYAEICAENVRAAEATPAQLRGLRLNATGPPPPGPPSPKGRAESHGPLPHLANESGSGD